MHVPFYRLARSGLVGPVPTPMVATSAALRPPACSTRPVRATAHPLRPFVTTAALGSRSDLMFSFRCDAIFSAATACWQRQSSQGRAIGQNY